VSVELPKTVPPLLIIAAIVIFYVVYSTQQNDFHKNLGIVIAVSVLIAGVITWYLDRKHYYHYLRYKV